MANAHEQSEYYNLSDSEGAKYAIGAALVSNSPLGI